MPIAITYSITDAKGQVGKMRLNIPLDTLLEDAIGFAQGVGDIMVDLLLGAITGISLAVEVPLTETMTGSAPAGALADVEEGVRFMMRTDGNHLSSFRIPTTWEFFFLSGTSTYNLAAPDVDELVDALTAGLIGPSDALVRACDAREELWVAVESAAEAFEPSRR